MLVPSMLALLVLAQPQAHGPERMAVDDAMRREGVSAEYLRPPPGVTLEQFARETVNADGLVRFGGGPPSEVTAPFGYRGLVIISGDGRLIAVSYRPDTHDGVCLMRARTNGSGAAARRASEWCAAGFGIEPNEQPPIIR